MMIFDTHANIISYLMKEPQLDNLLSQALEGHITGGVWMLDTFEDWKDPTALSRTIKKIKEVAEIHVVRKQDDWDTDAFNVLLGLKGLPEKLGEFFEQGFRHVALGKAQPKQEQLEEMLQLGMVVDVAGAQENTFQEVYAMTQQPLIATAVNCYDLDAAPHNITDSRAKLIAETDGFVSLTTRLAAFESRKATVSQLVDHIDYLKAKIGYRHVALGLNFVYDLHYNTPTMENCRTPKQAIQIIDEMYRRHYSSAEIEAIASHNAKRTINQILKPL